MFLVTNSSYTHTTSNMSIINKYENVVIIPGFPGCGRVHIISFGAPPRRGTMCCAARWAGPPAGQPRP